MGDRSIASSESMHLSELMEKPQLDNDCGDGKYSEGERAR